MNIKWKADRTSSHCVSLRDIVVAEMKFESINCSDMNSWPNVRL